MWDLVRGSLILQDRTSIGWNEEVAIDFPTERRDAIEKLHQVLVQPELDDIVGLAVVQPRVQLARRALDFPAVVVAQRLERLVDEVHARMQRAWHVLAENEQLGDPARRNHVAVDL